MADYIDCEGCGERVEIPEPRQANPMIGREQNYNDAPGRVTIQYGGSLRHQCADGTNVAPDRVAPPKSN